MRELYLSPEQNLQLHTLTDGLQTLSSPDTGLARESFAWLLDNCSKPFGFKGICDSINIDHAKLRACVLSLLARGEILPFIRGSDCVDLVAAFAAAGKTKCLQGHPLTVAAIFISFDEAGPQVRCRVCNQRDSRRRFQRATALRKRDAAALG